jgi:hypothetical protein
LKRLEKLRNCLVRRGFLITKLAKDLPDEIKYSEDMDEHYTIKSRKLIKDWADVPIYVYFKNSDNTGVTAELVYTCDSLPEKQSCCTVFFEGGLEDFSSQVKGSIKATRKISYEIFNNDKELCDLAFGHSLKMLDRLFYYLK